MRLAAENQTDPIYSTGFRTARRICKQHGKSFYLASFFLSRAKRNAAYAAGAFCRMTVEAIDPPGVETEVSAPTTVSPTCCGTNELDERMSLFRERLDDIYSGRLELPNEEFRSETQHVLDAFAQTVAKYEVPRDHFLAFAEGRRMDLSIRRYPTWGRLERYCYQSSGSVGLIMSAVLGVKHSGAAESAVAAGVAIRLTSILRNLARDFARGRLYLPLEDLARFEYAERDLAAGVVNEPFRTLMRFEVARTRELYRRAAEGVRWLADEGARRAASVVLARNAGVLDVIERRGYDVFSRPVELSMVEMWRCLPAAWRLSRRESGEPLPPPFDLR